MMYVTSMNMFCFIVYKNSSLVKIILANYEKRRIFSLLPNSA